MISSNLIQDEGAESEGKLCIPLHSKFIYMYCIPPPKLGAYIAHYIIA